MNKTFLLIKQAWAANMYAWCQQKAEAHKGNLSLDRHYTQRMLFYENKYLEATEQLSLCNK